VRGEGLGAVRQTEKQKTRSTCPKTGEKRVKRAQISSLSTSGAADHHIQTGGEEAIQSAGGKEEGVQGGSRRVPLPPKIGGARKSGGGLTTHTEWAAGGTGEKKLSRGGEKPYICHGKESVGDHGWRGEMK